MPQRQTKSSNNRELVASSTLPPSSNKHTPSLEDKKEKHTLAVWKDKVGSDMVAADINKK